MTPKQLWKRASAAVKDKCSLYLARTRRRSAAAGSSPWNRELEAAVIKATTHDEAGMDYKSVGSVFSWVRTCPSSSLPMLFWMLGRRIGRTHNWAVALKGLMLAHGVLLCRPSIPFPPSLPFDLSSFRDKSSKVAGKAAFLRAYFNFLDRRAAFSGRQCFSGGDEELACLRRLEMTQDLLDLLMQVRPRGECMDLPLILEAMDCVMVEIFDVYSSICDGVAQALVGIFGRRSKEGVERVKGRLGIRILRRATEQGSQLARYFELCKSLDILNNGDVPDIQRVPEEDILEIERLLIDVSEVMKMKRTINETRKRIDDEKRQEKQGTVIDDDEKNNYGMNISKWDEMNEDRPSSSCESLKTVVTTDWVLFEDSSATRIDNNDSKNPFLSPDGNYTPPQLICYDQSYRNHHFFQSSHSNTWLGFYNSPANISLTGLVV